MCSECLVYRSAHIQNWQHGKKITNIVNEILCTDQYSVNKSFLFIKIVSHLFKTINTVGILLIVLRQRKSPWWSPNLSTLSSVTVLLSDLFSTRSNHKSFFKVKRKWYFLLKREGIKNSFAFITVCHHYSALKCHLIKAAAQWIQKVLILSLS